MKEIVSSLYRFFERRMVFVPFVVSVVFVGYLGFLTYGHTLFVHDSSLYFTKSEALSRFGGLWKSDSFGYTDYLSQAVAFFSNILSVSLLAVGVPFAYSQLFIYLIIILTIWYGSWYAFKKTFELLKLEETLYSSFFASVLYTFNLYMIASWHGGTIVALFVIFAIAPAVLYIAISGIAGYMTIRMAVILGLTMGFSLYSAPFAVALFGAIFISFLLASGRDLIIKNSGYLSLASLASLIFGSVYVSLLVLYVSYSDPSPLRNGLDEYMFSGHGLFGVFRLFLEWTMNQSWGGRYFHSYYPYYTETIPVIAIFLLWCFAIFAIFVGMKKMGTDKKVVVFLIVATLLSVFISKADQAPLGNLNMFLYKHVPLFNMFRTPDTKFGLPLVLSFSLLVGYCLAVSRSYSVRSVVVGLIFIHVAIFFTTLPLVEVRAGDEYQRVFDMPREYYDISEIIDSDNQIGYVFLVPGTGYANFDYKNGTGLNGQDILGKLVDRPMIYKYGFIFGKSEKLYDDLSQNLHASNLADYGIRYVLVRKDILHTDTTEFSQKADTNSNLEKVYGSDLGDLYRVKNASDSLISMRDGSGSVDARFLPDSSIQYVHIKGLKGKADLTYLQSFHPGWGIYAGTAQCQTCLVWKSSYFDGTHHLVDNYANGWTVDSEYIKQNFPKDAYHENSDGSVDADLILYFKPQAYFYISLMVSGLALVGCLWYVGFLNKLALLMKKTVGVLKYKNIV